MFYQPGELGHEAAIKAEVERRREAQLAAMLEGGEGFGATEVLTYTGDRAGSERDRWLDRSISGAGERLALLRDRLIEAARLQRHSLVLDLNAGTGLLTWEAARRTPEGGVWSLAASADEAAALREWVARLSSVDRPVVLQGSLSDVAELLELRGEGDLRFDAILGRNALTPAHEMTAVSPDLIAEAREHYPALPSHLVGAGHTLAALLRAGGTLSLAELIGRRSQRLHALIDRARLDPDLAEKLVAAEEAIYEADDDRWVNWDERSLAAALEAAGFSDVTVDVVESTAEARIQSATLDRWFGAAPAGERLSYKARLSAILTTDELAAVEDLYRRQLTGQTVPWRSVNALVVARKPLG